MPATYTTSLKLALPTDGDTNWGSVVNNGVTNLVDSAIAGISTITLSSTVDRTLTDINGTADEARSMFLIIAGTPGGATNVICPTASKLYFISNTTPSSITLKTSAGTGVVVPTSTKTVLYCDGTNVVEAVNRLGALTLNTALPATSGGTGLSAVGTNGNVLTSNGTTWVSSAPASGVAGTNTTVQYNNSGVLAGSSALTFNGSTLTINGIPFGRGPGTLPDKAITIGSSAAGTNTTGNYNVAIGYGAFNANSTGLNSISIGAFSGLQSTGGNSVFLGAYTGNASGCSGENIIAIGYQATTSSTIATNEITLGNSSITSLRCQATSITSLSDARDKTNIQPLKPGLEFIERLNPVSFDWNMRDGGKVGVPDTGFIAQELQAALGTEYSIPGLVYDSNPERLEASYGRLIPVLVKAIQELTVRVEELEGKL